MIQFLYQGGYGSHGPRTEALVEVTPSSACGAINDTKPEAKDGLDTLAFWGHGDAYGLCGLKLDEIHDVIASWKKVNKGLKTIEIITCNARHCSGGDAFAERLKMRFALSLAGVVRDGVRSGTRGLVVKALPVNVGGKNPAWSILLWEPEFNSWCYVTAPGVTDKELHQAANLVKFETDPKTLGSRCFRGDIAIRANTVTREHKDRKWTMNFGYLPSLRAQLGVV